MMLLITLIGSIARWIINDLRNNEIEHNHDDHYNEIEYNHADDYDEIEYNNVDNYNDDDANNGMQAPDDQDFWDDSLDGPGVILLNDDIVFMEDDFHLVYDHEQNNNEHYDLINGRDLILIHDDMITASAA